MKKLNPSPSQEGLSPVSVVLSGWESLNPPGWDTMGVTDKKLYTFFTTKIFIQKMQIQYIKYAIENIIIAKV